MNAAELRNIRKVFSSSKSLWPFQAPRAPTVAVNNFSLTLKTGEIFALLGPNGSGKTTLLKLISQLLIPDEGEILIYEHSVILRPDFARLQVSLLLGEERSFYWRLTGRQNLEFFASLHHLSPAIIRKRIQTARDLFEIENLDRRYQEYSSGTKQRLALARCFITQARLLLMDEPTKNLDPNHAPRFRDLLKTFLKEQPDHAILLTTHNMDEAASIAHRIGILNQGSLQACGTLSELRQALPSGDQLQLEEIFHHYTATHTHG